MRSRAFDSGKSDARLTSRADWMSVRITEAPARGGDYKTYSDGKSNWCRVLQHLLRAITGATGIH